MEKLEAHQLIKEAEAFLGRRKAVVTESQLGLPSTIEECSFDGTILMKVRGEFLPMARMTSVNTRVLVFYEDLQTTLEYLRRQAK